METKPNWLDSLALAVSPRWGAARLRARLVAQTLRHYEAASTGRRTQGWRRSSSDANAAAGPALPALREHARDLVRNNGWARNAVRVISTNTVGWGITAKASGRDAARAMEAWRAWAETRQCDADGRLGFAGIQSLAMRTIVESGEVLVRRRRRRVEDGLAIPLQLQVLEPDFLDTGNDGERTKTGGVIVQGVEFDVLGRRVAYWLYDQHPGSALATSPTSRRIPAEDVLHVFAAERPGQTRGVSWLAPAIVNLKDFDEFADAQLVRQKIAACFAGFVVDLDGSGSPLAEQDADDALVETVEPGLMQRLRPGQDVRFGSPPLVTDDGFSVRELRRIAAAIGCTYEDLTGDYSQVNFSSARMGRIKHWANVEDWRWLMLIPMLCDGVWRWACDAMLLDGTIGEAPAVEWTAPPAPMLEPDREALAAIRRVRGGMATPSQIVREQGGDPETFFAEYAKDQKQLDTLGIWLDSDVRRTSQAGLTQERVGAGKQGSDGEDAAEDAPSDDSEPPADDEA